MALILKCLTRPSKQIVSATTSGKNLITKRCVNSSVSFKNKQPFTKGSLLWSLKTIGILSPAVIFVAANLPSIYCKQISPNTSSEEANYKSSNYKNCGNNDDREDKEKDDLNNANEKKELDFPWREFLKVLCPYSHWLLGAVVGAVAVAYLNIQIPLLLGEMVNVVVKYSSGAGDEGGSEDFLKSVFSPVKKLVIFYGLQGLGTSVYIALLFKLGEGIARDLKVNLFNSLIIKDVEFFDKNRTGDLINRLTVDVQEFKSSFKMLISQGLKNVVQTIGHVVSMIYISPKLTMVIVTMVMGMVAIGTAIGSALSRISKAAQKQKSLSTIVAEEAIGNLKTVRAFAMEETEMVKFERQTQESTDLNNKLGLGISIFQGLSNISINSLVLTTLFYGGWMMSQGELRAGSLMSLFMDTQAIQSSLNKLSILYGVAIQGLNAGSRVFEHTITTPGMEIKGGLSISQHRLHGDVSFENVSFAYPTRKQQTVLKKFSLLVQGGTKVALVGPSGGGKSTIVALLERFYDVQEGSIKVDGVDIRFLDPSWLRSRLIGYISQEPVLFATSIRENIRYGMPTATDQEVVEAAKLANAHDFITTFPHSYDTILGERGLTISGGQKQRIAIARALIKKPPMLILDEATSALDSESEKTVQEAIEGASKGRTVLMIAHRLSSIKDVDYIAVIERGSIVEYGTPEELKKKRGPFWHLMQSQQQ